MLSAEPQNEQLLAADLKDLWEYSEPEDEGKKIFLIFHAKVLKIEYSFRRTWITGAWCLAAELEGVSLSP